MLVGIATSADSPPRLRGKVVELDRFSAQVALETREPALRQGASVWLHFDPPGGGSPLSVGGIISGVARGGRITVLLSLSPGEYSRLRGLPEPPVQRSRRAVQPSTLAGIKPIRKPEAPEPRPEPGSSRPGQPVEAPAAVEPDLASLSPIERARAMAAALAELVGPRAEPASPRPVEPAEAPAGKVEAQPAPVSPPPVERAEPPPVIEPRGEPAWLPPAEQAHAPVEPIEPPPQPASVSPAEPAEAPAEMVEEAHAPVEPLEPSPEPASVSPREQAEALISRGDLEGAWKVYYDALRVEPDDLRLWYGLGRTLSRLNRPKETEEIFQYVVNCGDPDSEEAKHARKWLAGARLLAEAAAPAVPAAPRRVTDPWATVWGKVTWGEPEPPREAFLVIQGLDKDAPRSHARVPLGQFYEFDGLPPGSYRLIGGVETEWLWDFRFTVEAGQQMVLDLSRQNSTSPTAQV